MAPSKFEAVTERQREQWKAAHEELSAKGQAVGDNTWPSKRLSETQDQPVSASKDTDAQPVVKRRRIGTLADGKQPTAAAAAAAPVPARCARTVWLLTTW